MIWLTLALAQTCEVVVMCDGQPVGASIQLPLPDPPTCDSPPADTGQLVEDTAGPLGDTGDTGALAAVPERIVIILADDIGEGALTAQTPYAWTTPPAPALDALAASGARFSRGYAAPNCSPARAELLTGRLGARDGVPSIHEAIEVPALDRAFPHAFQAAGWSTYFAGKWHLSGIYANPGIPVLASEPRTPTEAGFASWHATEAWWEGGSGRNTEGADHPPADWAPVPWLVGTETGAHVELTGEPSVAALDLAADHLEAHPHQSLVLVALGDAHTPYTAPPSYYDPAWAAMTSEEAPGYWAETAALAAAVGGFRARLDTKGLLDGTLILFTSDNGAREWPGTQWYPNGNAAGYKHSVHEGGVRVPWVLHWPAGGVSGVYPEVVRLADVGATLAELAGVPYAPLLPTDGESFAALLRGEPWQRSGPVPIVDGAGNAAILDPAGRWKLERIDSTDTLLDLHADIRGETDVSALYPTELGAWSATLDTELASIATSASCSDYPGAACGPVGPSWVRWYDHPAYAAYHPAWCDPYFTDLNPGWNQCD